MLSARSAVYHGKEKKLYYTGLITGDRLFLLLELEDISNAELIEANIQKIKSGLNSLKIDSLASFDGFITDIITANNLPASFSISAGYFTGEIFYLKTNGLGKIFLKRGNNFVQLIEKDNSASGYVMENDFFVFTSQKMINTLGSDIELKTIFDHRDPENIAKELTGRLTGHDDEGSAAIFVMLNQEEFKKTSEIAAGVIQQGNLLADLKNKGSDYISSLKEFTEISGKRKIITLVFVVIILFILVWSVGFGVKRRNDSEISRKINSAEKLVNFKLNQAKDIAALDLPRSLELISEAKQVTDKLKNETGGKRKEIGDLQDMIRSAENKIVKKEQKNYEEFYDLKLDSQDVKGDRLYSVSDTLSILSKNKGKIYTLSLSKKSLDSVNGNEIKKADLIASYNDYSIFYVKGEGIFKAESAGTIKRVIVQDNEWGDIKGLWIYNGNLYLLDGSKGDIYKYLVSENGYSEKNSYLKSNAGELKDANSFAIDNSVYVGFAGGITKYTAGSRDDFSTTWPVKGFQIEKIFTGPDTDNVYAWDKNRGSIYILDKNGGYEKQIESDILTKITDFSVYDNSAFLLLNEKIYKISL